MIKDERQKEVEQILYIRWMIDSILGSRMFLSKDWKEYKKIVGIKKFILNKRVCKKPSSVFKLEFPHLLSRPPHENHLIEMISIIENYKSRILRVSRSNIDRLTHLSCPNHGINYKEFDSGPFEISAFDALEIFEKDFNFLIGPLVDEHLDGKGRIEKKRVLAAIASDRPSSLVGVGSKVTLARYHELVRSTESAWRTLLAMRGIRPRTVSQISSETNEDLRPAGAERLAA